MSNKFSDNIKRIIGEKRSTATQVDLQDVGGVAPVRGIGTQSPAGSGATSQKAGTDESAAEDKNKQNLKGDKKTAAEQLESEAANANNPSSMFKSPTAGIYDAKDVIDGKDGPQTAGSVQDFFGTASSEALSGITAEDCDSGKALNIRVDGLYAPIAETTYPNGTVKESAWPDPNVPPDKQRFQLGYYWGGTITQGGTTTLVQGATPDEVADGFVAIADTGLGAPFSIVTFSPNGTPAESYSVRLEGDVQVYSLIINRSICTGGESESLCPATAPKETQWPDDDTISLTYSGGTFNANQYDGDATPKYSGQQSSHINMCIGDGRHAALVAAKEGGTLLYETDGANGPPLAGSVVRYYAGDGSLAGFGDVASIKSWLP